MATPLPDHLKVPAQFYAVKTVVTVMLMLWITSLKDPKGAAEEFEKTLLAFIQRLPPSDIPPQHFESFRSELRATAMAMLQFASNSWPMGDPTTRQ